MTILINDIKYAIRRLLRNPGFTAIALITLSIGIGANIIMFSVVDVLIFRPTLVREPERLVECQVRNFMGGLHYEAYLEVRDNNPVFSDLVAYDYHMNAAMLVLGNAVRRVGYMYVSANYFSTLGVMPILGRPFLPEEERADTQPVAILSHHLWKQQGAILIFWANIFALMVPLSRLWVWLPKDSWERQF